MKRKQLLEVWKGHQIQTSRAVHTDADDDGQWVTTENGHHVHINGEGDPDIGNKHVVAAMNKGRKEKSSTSSGGNSGNNKLPSTMEDFKTVLKTKGLTEKEFWDNVKLQGGDAIKMAQAVMNLPDKTEETKKNNEKSGIKSASSPQKQNKTEASKTTPTIAPKADSPQRPTFKKCKSATDDALKSAGGTFWDKTTPDTYCYEFSGKMTAKAAATHVINGLREKGFDADFYTAGGDVSEKPTGSIYVSDPKRDFGGMEYHVYKSQNTAPGKTYISVDIIEYY